MRITALIALMLASPALAAPAIENFRRGINLSHWYAQSPVGTYEEDRLASYVTEADAKLVADMGFDHVRLTLDDAVLFDPENPGELKVDALDKFRERMQMFLDAGVNVVVDLHPDPDYKTDLREADHAEAFVKDWAALAAALSDTVPARVWLEVLNEPHPIDGAEWRALQGEALAAIRAAAPEHTVVVSAGAWSPAAGLYGAGGDEDFEVADADGFEPYDDPNVVYTFHFYDPHIWTHQSASWGWEVARRVADLPWPADPADAGAIVERSTQPGDDEAVEQVRHYVESGRGTREWATDKFDRVAAWQKRHGGVPVYVGEFGAYTKTTPPQDRLAWTEFVVNEFEDRGWGWAMWDYAGGFRVALGEPSDREPDPAMVEALGPSE